MQFSFQSLNNFKSFNECEVIENGSTRLLPEQKDKKFLFLHWKVKLMIGVDKKTNELKFAYFSKFERLIRKILPSLFFNLDINKNKICDCLKTKIKFESSENPEKYIESLKMIIEPKGNVRTCLGRTISRLFRQTHPEITNKAAETAAEPVKSKEYAPKEVVNEFMQYVETIALLTPEEIVTKKEEIFKKVEDLLKKIPDINAPLSTTLQHTFLTFAIDKNCEPVIRHLVESKKVDVNQCNNFGESPLAVAIKKEVKKATILLLDASGAQIKDESEKNELLKFAEDRAYLGEILKKPLMEKKLESVQIKKTQFIEVNEKTQTQITNLKNFLDQDTNVDGVKRIIDSIPDLNILLPNDVNTPLTLAIEKNNRPIIEYLVNEKKVDPNQPNKSGKSPIALAVEMDVNKFTIKTLLDAGAKPKNEIECNALIKMAGEFGKENLVIELKKFKTS